jgi:hypothetical protein
MPRPSTTLAVDLVPVVVGAAVLAIFWYVKFSGAELWYDEVQSVTFAGRPLLTALFSAIVYDPHPPLYYILLHFWMVIAQSDRTILASSLLLVALTGVVLNIHCLKYFDRITAAGATLLFLVHPYALYWSGQARMYAAVMLFAMLFHHANAGYFLGDDRRSPGRRAIWVFLCGAALALLHNCGILFCGTIALYWLLHARAGRNEPEPASSLIPWLSAQGCVVLLSLPFIAHSLIEHLRQTERPNVPELVAAIGSMTIGPERLPEGLGVVGALATLMVLAMAARSADLRLTAGVLVLLPILAFWLVSNLLKPIWVADRLFAFIVPFFCIVAARGLNSGARMPRPSRAGARGAAALGAGLVLIGIGVAGDWRILATYVKPTDWRGAAALVRADAPNGGTVEVEQLRDRWSLNWYLAGRGWDDGIQEALLEAVREPGPRNPVKRVLGLRDAMERFETAKSRGKYTVEAELSEPGPSNQSVFVFTEYCPASEFWNLYLHDPNRKPEQDFYLKYEALPPIKGLCGYIRRPHLGANHW